MAIRSDRKTAARRRIRERAETDMLADIELVYEKPVEEWDWEELSKGRPRNEDGTYPPGRPKWITPAIQAEVQRRMRALTEEQLMTHACDAIRVLTELMQTDDIDDFGKPIVPATVRVDAAKYIINQVIGTPRARLDVSGTSNPLEDLLVGVLVNPDGSDSHNVIDAAIDEPEDEGEGE